MLTVSELQKGKTSGITLKDKIGYALGDTGGCLTFGIVGSFLQMFYTNVLRYIPTEKSMQYFASNFQTNLEFFNFICYDKYEQIMKRRCWHDAEDFIVHNGDCRVFYAAFRVWRKKELCRIS